MYPADSKLRTENREWQCILVSHPIMAWKLEDACSFTNALEGGNGKFTVWMTGLGRLFS